MRAERIWQRALQLSSQAQASGALVPLATEVLTAPQHEPFVLRRLLSATPKHLRRGGPKPNPFLPWERALEVDQLDSGHVVLLNKYPVQAGHLLLITASWQPQSGWLSGDDWRAVAHLAGDTGGLWFFNSCAASGASQPPPAFAAFAPPSWRSQHAFGHSYRASASNGRSCLALGLSAQPPRRSHGGHRSTNSLFRACLATGPWPSPLRPPTQASLQPALRRLLATYGAAHQGKLRWFQPQCPGLCRVSVGHGKLRYRAA